MRDALVVVPCYEHTLAVYYLNALLRLHGRSPLCLDLEYFLARDRPDLLKRLSRLFHTYDLEPVYRIDFVTRLDFLLDTLFEPKASTAGAPGDPDLVADLSPFVERWIWEICRAAPQRLLFPVTNRNFWLALWMIRGLRQSDYRGGIYLGGVGVASPAVVELVEGLGWVDGVARGEAMDDLAQVGAFCDIDRFSGSDLLAMIGQGRLLPEPRGFPGPGLDFRSYWSVALPSKCFLPVAGSFGCRFHCAFCHESGREFHLRRTPEQVAGEIRRQAERHGFGVFGFCDPTLNAEPGWVEELCGQLSGFGAPLQFRFAHIRADLLSDNAIGAMKEAGFVHLNMGVESPDEAACRRMGKGCPRGSRPLSAIQRAARAGLEVSVNLFSNYPGMSVDEFERILEGVRKLLAGLQSEGLTDRVRFTVHPTRIDPLSRLYRREIEEYTESGAVGREHVPKHLAGVIGALDRVYRDVGSVEEEDRYRQLSSLLDGANTTSARVPLDRELGVLRGESRLIPDTSVAWYFKAAVEGSNEGWLVGTNGASFAVDRAGRRIFEHLMGGLAVVEVASRLEEEGCGPAAPEESVLEIAAALVGNGVARPAELQHAGQ